MTFTICNPMPPMWLMYPYIHPQSIGWRMSFGEGYRLDFFKWYEELPENEQEQYREMFPPPKFGGWQRHCWSSGFDKQDEHARYYGVGVGDYRLEHWRENGEPQYSKEWLITNRANSKFVFFWKPGDIDHEPECCFGQWQYSEFKSANGDIVDYTCAEQYMMAEKARLFGDEEIKRQIIAANHPKQMKALGRKVRNFDDKIWLKLRHSVVLSGNYLKFAQNKNMRDILLSTGDKVLVEASPLDLIWGIGYTKNSPEATRPQNWRGSNLLGFALMEVRDEIRRVYQNYEKINWAQFADYSSY